MKRSLFALFAILCLTIQVIKAQERFLSECFEYVEVQTGIHYASNYDVLTGSPSLKNLFLDVYEPTGDSLTERPAIILIHSGGFLPHPVNMQTEGTRSDSTVVGIARRLARSGYVVVSIDYRLGWNPFSPSIEIRNTQIIQAIYRGIQDVHSAIRFLNKSYIEDGNPWGIDTSRIVVWGIGSGGWLSLNTIGLRDHQQMLLPKFTRQDSSSMVPFTDFGDPSGSTETDLNVVNHPGYSSNFHLGVNLSGALGDTMWLNEDMVPLISFHAFNDFIITCYDYYISIPPNPPSTVFQHFGSCIIQDHLDSLGNHHSWKDAGFMDPFTQRASSINGGVEGFFPFDRSQNLLDVNPWSWWSADNVNHENGLHFNPDMSFEKAMIFTDSILGYFWPRAYHTLSLDLLSSSTNEPNKEELSLFPNPGTDIMYITRNPGITGNIVYINLLDITGKLINVYHFLNEEIISLNISQYPTGLYMVTIFDDHGNAATGKYAITK